MNRGLLLVRLAAAAPLIVALAACGTPDYCDASVGRDMAAIMSEGFIKDRLLAPASARFPRASAASVTKTGDCSYSVISYVDAQNGFGALIRQVYSITMTYVGNNTWRASNIVL